MQKPQLLAHDVPEFRIKRAQRLVHQECLRPPDDRPAQCNPLAIPRREPADAAVQNMVDPKHLGHFFGAGFDFASRKAGETERKRNIPADGHVRVESEQLEYERDVALRSAFPSHVFAVDPDVAGGRQFQTGNHSKRRGLSAAGRAEHHEELAVADSEVQVADGDELVEFLPDA